VRLPVSRRQVSVRPPGGAEDLLLVEAPALDTALAVELATRLGPSADDAPLDWWTLPSADLDAWLLALRRLVLGDLLRSSTRCPAPDCDQPIDIAFHVGDYLAHHRPRRPRGLAAPEAGWLALGDDAATHFRIPTVADQHAAATAARPRALLGSRCLRRAAGAATPPRIRRRIERALDKLAPCLADDLAGVCPECGAEVTVAFDPVTYVLRELRDQGAWIYHDVHLLASAYGWREPDVLALPAARRARYAELALAERGRS
jgi:hypothetical protein